jgi:hypothetical protein
MYICVAGGATELALPRQRQVRGSTAPILPRSQLRSADSSPVPSNPDSLANSPVTPFHFKRDLGSSGGTGTSTTAPVAASRSYRLPDSDVAGSAVVAAATVRSPPRPDFVPKLALGQPEAERGTEAAADNQRRPLVNELSLEQVLVHRTRTYRTHRTLRLTLFWTSQSIARRFWRSRRSFRSPSPAVLDWPALCSGRGAKTNTTHPVLGWSTHLMCAIDQSMRQELLVGGGGRGSAAAMAAANELTPRPSSQQTR